MIGFMIAMACIACFVLGAYVAWRFTEYYSRIIRDMRRPAPRAVKREDGFEALFTAPDARGDDGK